MSERPSPFIILDGFKWPRFEFPHENFDLVRNLELREGDVILNTYPKCGTTWTSYIIWQILNQGLPLPQPKELMEQIPFVDWLGVDNFEGSKESHRQLTTHLPIPYFPYKSSVKYIVTIRNPFDCCVSFYHFTAKTLEALGIPMTFEHFFETFFTGEVPYGDYFDHLLSWYEKRNDPNVLLLEYEEMVRDRKKCILDVARFLGEVHLQNMEGEILEKVLEHTSFEHMKSQLDYTSLAKEKSRLKSSTASQSFNMFRKGIVGDWKSCFAEDQKLRLKQKMEEKLKGTELLDKWLKNLNFDHSG